MAPSSITPASAAPITLASRGKPLSTSRPGDTGQELGLGCGLLMILFLAAAVVVPRSYSIARAHSESYDDDYHLKRGLLFLTGRLGMTDVELNDPPLGEGLVAIPMLVTNLLEGRAPADDRLYDTPGRAETIAVRTGVWNSLLFVGFLGVVWAWCRRLYGWQAAGLAVALFAVEPSFAAHVPIAALDVMGVESIVIAAFLSWRYFERPTTGRMVGMAVGIAIALLVKHTALVLPPTVVALAGLHWLARRRGGGQPGTVARPPFLLGACRVVLVAEFAFLALWALTLFDFSPPMNRADVARQQMGDNGGPVSPGKALRVSLERKLHLELPWPAGCYLRALRLGVGHGTKGHQAYLNGRWSDQGWPSYFPIVASYKIPIGIGVVFLVALASLPTARPRWAEWGLVVPLGACVLLALTSKINIGFRHFLPSYAFMLMLGSRALCGAGSLRRTVAWAGVAAAGLHALTYHPDYLGYINAPWKQPYLAISDSNVDWGQALKEVAAWLDAHPPGEKKVSLCYFGKDNECVSYYLKDRVEQIDEHSPVPRSGWLLISPVRLVGVYEEQDRYADLRVREPDAVIGHSILVYDLDRLEGGSAGGRPVVKGTLPGKREHRGGPGSASGGALEGRSGSE